MKSIQKHFASSHVSQVHNARRWQKLGGWLFTFLALSLYASAQTWSPTVLPLSAGSATDVTGTADGAVYVSGQSKDAAGQYHAAVLKSSDRGGTWTTVLSSEAIPDMIYIRAITAAAVPVVGGGTQEQLFAVAVTRMYVSHPTESGWVRGWEVLRSVDSGQTWESVSNGPYDFGYYSQEPKGIAVDSAGNVYVAGQATERVQTVIHKTTTATDFPHWLVRKGTANGLGGFDWSTVANLSGSAAAVVCVGSNVFVAGALNNVWQVHGSGDGGLTWSAIDQYQLEAGQVSQPFSLASDGANGLISAGRGFRTKKNSTEQVWVVRKGTTTGGFAPIDTYVTGAAALPTCITFGSQGKIEVGGSFGFVGGWAVREGTSINNSWAWSTTDLFGPNSSASCNGIALDSQGDLFAVGSSNGNWVIRRRLAVP